VVISTLSTSSYPVRSLSHDDRPPEVFPVVDGEDKLCLTSDDQQYPARDPEVVRRGNEKVIRARLADARSSSKRTGRPFDNRVEALKKVTSTPPGVILRESDALSKTR